MAALDVVYTGIIEDHRRMAEAVGETDPITGHARGPLSHSRVTARFFRAHVESSEGEILTTSTSEKEAAIKARAKVS